MIYDFQIFMNYSIFLTTIFTAYPYPDFQDFTYPHTSNMYPHLNNGKEFVTVKPVMAFALEHKLHNTIHRQEASK